MTTVAQRSAAFSVTRIIIFILGVLTILLESPIADVCGIISLAAWLWMPQLVGWELKILDKWSNK